MTLGTTEVENNQMGKPMVNPGKDSVAIYGALAFPKGGNGLGFPSGDRPWLVDSGNVAIGNKPGKNTLLTTKNSNYYQEYFVGSKFYDTRTKLDLFMFQGSRKGRKGDSISFKV